jgi:hypothetical protein
VTALAVLRWRRRRRVLSRRVLAVAGATAAGIPAAGVLLALVAGAAVPSGIIQAAAVVVMWRAVARLWAVHRRLGAEGRALALAQAHRGPLAAAVKRRTMPVKAVPGEVLAGGRARLPGQARERTQR